MVLKVSASSPNSSLELMSTLVSRLPRGYLSGGGASLLIGNEIRLEM